MLYFNSVVLTWVSQVVLSMMTAGGSSSSAHVPAVADFKDLKLAAAEEQLVWARVYEFLYNENKDNIAIRHGVPLGVSRSEAVGRAYCDQEK